VPQGEAIRGLDRYRPLEVNDVTFAHRLEIGNGLRKFERRRLGNTGNAAAHEANGAGHK
jgi:hypothetical protein